MADFNSIKVGERAELKHIITASDLQKFTELTGDDNKLHVDSEYAKLTSYKKPVVHGMLSASFISTIIGTKLPGDGALWFAQSIEFLLPVRIGDEIRVVAEVIGKNETQQYIELSTDIFNQHNQKIISGTAKVKVVSIVEEQTKEKAVEQTRKVLVIGATGGIGKEISIKLAEEGNELILHYNTNRTAAESLKEQLEQTTKVHLVQANLLDEKSVEGLIGEVKRKFDYLTGFVNASTVHLSTITIPDLKWKNFEDNLNINIKLNFTLIQQLLHLMVASKYGKVLFITTQAIETPNKGWLPYITAKSALSGFAKALAIELAGMGIRVNCISPGMVDTELVADIPEKQKMLIAAKAPLKRLATATEIAEAASFLLSSKSDYITGETLRINGGQFML